MATAAANLQETECGINLGEAFEMFLITNNSSI